MITANAARVRSENYVTPTINDILYNLSNVIEERANKGLYNCEQFVPASEVCNIKKALKENGFVVSIQKSSDANNPFPHSGRINISWGGD